MEGKAVGQRVDAAGMPASIDDQVESALQRLR